MRLAAQVIQQLESEGFDAYIVGGAVRNRYIGCPIKDIDITTSAPPAVITSLFYSFETNAERHETVLVKLEDELFEVSTFRAGGSGEYGLFEDLKRRDFTMNAIALSPDLDYIDPLNGRKDINARLIRAPEEPLKRFLEDPLRLLRAIRFIAQFNYRLETNTEQAVPAVKEDLQEVALERVGQEFEEILCSSFTDHALQEAERLGIIAIILPIQLENVQYSFSKNELIEREEHIAAFFISNQIGSVAAKQLLTGLKRSKALKQKVGKLITWFEWRSQHGWDDESLYKAGLMQAIAVERLLKACQFLNVAYDHEVKTRWDRLPIHTRTDLALNGADLISLTGYQAGAWVNQWLYDLEVAILRRELSNTGEAVKDWVVQRREEDESG